MPAKITFAGENTYQIGAEGVGVCKLIGWGLTSPTPSPRVVENVRRTLTVGFSHRDNLSSAVLD